MKNSNLKFQIKKYDHAEIEAKWQKKWEESGLYKPDLDKAKKPFFNLMMFPYPSAEGMHVGNMYAFTGADIYGRFKRMQGNDVFEPIGLDGFGIHSENYAIKVGRHPKVQAKISEENFYRQLRSTGNGFDWSRTVETYDQDYYKWTQWIFTRLFKKGLAYRKTSPVNFCPKDLTVLADEQVIDGKCERCGSVVEKRELEQWFFKITAYADRLLEGLDKIDWTEKVKIAQRNWIGRSEGTLIEFKTQSAKGVVDKIEVFTTRGDTLYGATFIVLAPEHPISISIKDEKVQAYIKQAKKKADQERVAEEKEKTGVFSGLYAVNPLNGEKIPVWIADYALMGYGTGALFGDAHDERDVVFAKRYGIPLKPTLKTGDKERDARIISLEECFTGDGILFDSGEFSGLTSKEARKKVKEWLSKHNAGGAKTTYHLRDWLISRQRYWGPPIPMIHCDKCGWQPVLDKDLPVLLPEVKDWKPKGTGKSPLASVASFVQTTCPNCDSKAVRETDVSDTFLDSAWYFLRYLATDRNDIPFPSEAFKPVIARSEATWQSTEDRHANARDDISKRTKWLPVSMYIGGAEHSVLHLLYVRFLTMVFHDLGLIDFDEPFPRFYAHGLLIKEGAKMSKSKGNVVVPDAYIKKYGADTLRTYLMFLGPFSQGGDFYDSSIGGVYRFLGRVYNLCIIVVQQSQAKSAKKNSESTISENEQINVQKSTPDWLVETKIHRTIKKVSDDMEGLRFNTAIAALMELLNTLQTYQNNIQVQQIKPFLLMLAPFAPHVTEELWDVIARSEVTRQSGKDRHALRARDDKFNSIHIQPWPKYDPKFLEQEEVTIAVQIDGKVRDQLQVKSSKLKVQSAIEKQAMESEKVRRHIEGKKIKKVIYVEGKILNFVTG